jgi:hypothetical protein
LDMGISMGTAFNLRCPTMTGPWIQQRSPPYEV